MKLLDTISNSVNNQKYSSWYKHQLYPVIGAIESFPTALMSGLEAIKNVAQAIFSYCFNKGGKASNYIWAARDLLVIFGNNVLNICTLGVLNCVLLNHFNIVGKRLVDYCSKPVEGSLQLPAGDHEIMLQHNHYQNHKKGDIVRITTSTPIYRFENVRFKGMQNHCTCLVMGKQDFENIQNTIHPGAFGGCNFEIEPNLMAVWKIPVDLLYISDYIKEKHPIPNPVGTYQLSEDYVNFTDNAPDKLINIANATKLRIDKKTGPFDIVSIHYFSVHKNDKKYNLPGISTGNFFTDFYEPTIGEAFKVKQMIEELKNYGIFAFSCNTNHHAIILYTYVNNLQEHELMTPTLFAELLQKNEKIFQVIQKAANQNMENWKNAFIETFGSKRSMNPATK